MIRPADCSKGLGKVLRSWKAGNIDLALKDTDTLLEAWPGTPQLHSVRASLIQLSDDPSAPSLEDARKALHRAAELDEESPAWPNELGHFLFSVQDAPKEALRCFDQAEKKATAQLEDALLGKARALQELGRRSEALHCLGLVHFLRLHARQEKAAGSIMESLLMELEKDAIAG